MPRATLFVPAVAVALILANAAATVEAKDGNSLFVAPDAGELGTTVELRSDFWTPNADVAIYAGFADQRLRYDEDGVLVSMVEPERWWGPIAETRSDEVNPRMGRWSVAIDLDAAGLPLPDRPGFIMLKAVTEGGVSEGAQVVGKSEVTDFALVVDGERPNGAGGINLTVSLADGIGDESFLYTIDPVTSDTFFYPYAGVMQTNRFNPFETTRLRLVDGDYFVYVRPVSGAVVGDGQFEQLEARLCFGTNYCEPRRTLMVKRVSVRDGQYTGVEVVLGEPGSPLEVLPAAGAGLASQPLVWPALAATIGAGLLLLGAWLLVRRRRLPD